MDTIIKWYGHSAFEITVGAQNLLLDPWFNGNPKTEVRAGDFKKVDLIAVSHGHSDHFGDALEIMRGTGAKLVCTTITSWYAELRGITKESGRNVSMAQGGTVTEGNMRISMVPAIHSSALFADEWPLQRQYSQDGDAVGYVIRTPGEHAIYFAGDTDIFCEMQFIERKYKPDVAILPIGGRFTMDTETAMMALELLGPRYLIPMHYNTHGLIPVDTAAFAREMKERFPGIELLLLEPGEEFVLHE